MSQPLSFQQMIMRLLSFWEEQGCLIQQPYNVQVGAGTMNPATFLRVLGPEPWNVAYVEPSRRPTDGRYGENPNRLQHYYQYQVILKPSPYTPLATLERGVATMAQLARGSRRRLGIAAGDVDGHVPATQHQDAPSQRRRNSAASTSGSRSSPTVTPSSPSRASRPL